MFFRSKAVRALVFLFVVIGVGAFVVDFLNPATPTPIVWLRVAILAQLVLAVIRFLIPCRISLLDIRSENRRVAILTLPVEAGLNNALDLTCLRRI